ncbi:hypothetical protein [Haloplanus sp. C73]|uniref:hypothetical protein n=1 Tax=Haloplanus sp. C73 TaxID=3421641 RepID=UPI003EB8028E
MSRRGGSRFGVLTWVAAAVLITAALGGVSPTTAFTTGDVDRSSAVDVVTDPEAALGVDSATAVHTNSTDPLVDTTNRLDRATTVTVSLRDNSTSYADLVVDGTNEGDSISLSLGRGDAARVSVVLPDDESLVGSTVRFDVSASASGLHVSATDRRVPIES